MQDNLTLKWNFRIRSVDAAGNTVQERQGHNIFLDTGRNWLRQLLAYDTTLYVPGALPPDLEPNPVGAPYERTVTAPATAAGVHMPFLPFYVGLGIGGNQQTGPIPPTLDTDYPGTNIQTDSDRTITGLERPVRVVTDGLNPMVTVRWLQCSDVSLPVGLPYRVRYQSTFAWADINNGFDPATGPGVAYPVVPISEAGLYRWNLSAAPPATGDVDELKPTYGAVADLPYVSSTTLAYKTFPVISKTLALGLIVDWSLIVE